MKLVKITSQFPENLVHGDFGSLLCESFGLSGSLILACFLIYIALMDMCLL